MSAPDAPLQLGAFTGRVSAAFTSPPHLAAIQAFLTDPGQAEPIRDARNLLSRFELSTPAGTIQVASKCFGRESAVKDHIDRTRGTKAQRSWEVAEYLVRHTIGTPTPIGYFDRWEGSRLAESYYFCEFRSETATFKSELIRLFRTDPLCSKVMELMQVVAHEVRKLHEAGVMHRDLGNQNIFVEQLSDSTWGNVAFFDLNRSRIKPALSVKEQARDLSRIYLPSDLKRVFIEMMYAPEEVPPEVKEQEARCRRRFDWHTRTRKYRHPIRSRKARYRDDEHRYPAEPDLYIWDDRSGQPISALTSKGRHQYFSKTNHVKVVSAVWGAFPSVKKAYKQLRTECFQQPVTMAGRFGLALAPPADQSEKQLELLEQLGPMPLLVRCYHHETLDELQARIRFAEQLADKGFPVSVALIQDRAAVLKPDSWRGFIDTVLKAVHSFVDYVEVGHAVNRVKWGVWSFLEYRQLVAAVQDAQQAYPNLRFMGPAVIDFEYHYLAALLRQLPKGFQFKALSHHLYVDRRGAPENFQGSFSALEKMALARAFARTNTQCDDQLIISEVNWPLKNTGVYSPVVSPYDTPGDRPNEPSVTEEDYASYMIRYALIALCSGMAERLYWWQLVAHGYGLVDDLDNYRLRPAWFALKTFLEKIGPCEFVERQTLDEGVHVYRFKSVVDGACWFVAYCSLAGKTAAVPFEYAKAFSLSGDSLPGAMELSSSPCYFQE